MNRLPLVLLVTLLGSCAADPETTATLAVKDSIDAELTELHAAVVELREAAPEPDADGWNPTDDRPALEAMRAAWLRARVAYEHIEGAIAVLFPHIDQSTDQRYDAFIEVAGDTNLFDRTGVTGMHAVERILWAGEHPAEVVAFESALTGYQEARTPSNEAEARAFRDELLQRLIEDVTTMRDQFAPLALDPAAAFRGVVGSMQEQFEKVRLAATGEDESRYSQLTLADMRANLAGGRTIYGSFAEWVRSVDGGAERDARIAAGFDRVAAAYAAVPGDSLPPVPEGWNPDAPDPSQLATPYGQLWQLLSTEADPATEGSLVAAMNDAADSIGIPTLP
ncbi:MAG: EfeM/EfeO family lipoprotein [Sandaracinaceae bacterium]|nr:EfeM/EfeO family lipoprotein [Sandaracinaceae bacterium]